MSIATQTELHLALRKKLQEFGCPRWALRDNTNHIYNAAVTVAKGEAKIAKQNNRCCEPPAPSELIRCSKV